MQTSREQKEIFNKLAHFVSPPNVGDQKLPEIIMENIVEGGLIKFSHPKNKEEIKKEIEKEFKIFLNSLEIDRALRKLVKKERVFGKNRNQFILEVKRRELLEKQIKEEGEKQELVFKKFDEYIASEYKDKLTTEENKNLLDDFRMFLVNFFCLLVLDQ